ncbi:MAG: NADH:ubiquinone reductase (Na(+)-transporting) subunit A, partial [Bacteroidales bacterium]|nr:NADH:ubiquinone reductase (Na(+)-transporting) subunit A [Bacteroidales bacterium]
ISAFDTAPLAPDYKILFEGQNQVFQAGLDVLAKLTDGKLHLNLRQGETAEIFTKAKAVELTYFDGPHPAGNHGIQINKMNPVNKGDVVWTLRPQDVIMIGRLFVEGHYNAEKVIALAGSEVEKPQYFKSLNGASISAMIKGNLKQTNVRYISGNVLTGKKIEKDGYVGFYDNQVSVIPEGDYYDFIGWLKPYHGDKFSFYRSTLSWLTPKKKYRLNTNLNGGERAFVMTGSFEKVFPMDIYPIQLIKAVMIGDIDQMEALGIYEVDEEDFALCEYISTSKIEIQSIIRSGLDLMRKEMS